MAKKSKAKKSKAKKKVKPLRKAKKKPLRKSVSPWLLKTDWEAETQEVQRRLHGMRLDIRRLGEGGVYGNWENRLAAIEKIVLDLQQRAAATEQCSS